MQRLRDTIMSVVRDEEDDMFFILSADDRKEIFLSILPGAQDITKELLIELCESYGLNLNEVLANGQ